MDDFVYKTSRICAAIWVGYLVGSTSVVLCRDPYDFCMLNLISGSGPSGDLFYLNTPAKLTASSTLSPTSFYSPEHAKLHFRETSNHSGGWVAGKNTATEFIQAEFPGMRQIEGIITAGREGFTPEQFIKYYRVLYSTDCLKFETVKDSDGMPMVFQGKSGDLEYWVGTMPYLIKAKCIRINPVSWNNHIALRFEVTGCDICSGFEFKNGDSRVSVIDSVTTVELTCDTGFELTGDGTFSCLANGSWSKEIPYCRYQGCGTVNTQTVFQDEMASFVVGKNSIVNFFHLPEFKEQKYIVEVVAKTLFSYEDDSYEERLYSIGNDSYLIIALKGMQAEDSGTYFATRLGDTVLCFQVTVLGPPSTPVIAALSETGGFEEYTTGRFSCLCYVKSSSNGEEFHNTKEVCPSSILSTIIWKLDGHTVHVCGNGRYRQHGYDLEIANLTRNDAKKLTNLSCAFTDRNKGTFTSFQSFELPIYYGPDNVLLTPKQSEYTMDDGDVIPDIVCKADCNPPCSMSWRKYGERGVLTTIGTNILSLGTASDSLSGAYVCTATRNSSTSFRTKSVVVRIMVKSTTSGNSTACTTGIVGGLLGTLLLIVSAAFVIFCCLMHRNQRLDFACLSFRGYRKKDCSNGNKSELQNLNGNRACPEPNGSEAASNYDTPGTDEENVYSELNAGSRNAQVYETASADATVGAATGYENNKLRV